MKRFLLGAAYAALAASAGAGLWTAWSHPARLPEAWRAEQLPVALLFLYPAVLFAAAALAMRGASAAERTLAPPRMGAAAWTALLGGCLALLWIPYGDALRNYFIYDDFTRLTEAATFFAGRPLEKILWNVWYNIVHSNFIRPGVTSLWAVFYPRFELDPLPYHLFNLGVNALSGLALAALALELTASRTVAALAGALFLLHPIHPEATTGVSNGFDNVPVTLFYFLALWGYARARRTGRPALHGLGVPAAFLAFAFKESGLGIPFSLAALELCWGGVWGGSWKRRLAHLAPYAALFGAYMALRVHLFGDIGGYKGPSGGSRYFNVDFALMLWRDATALPYMLLAPVNAKVLGDAYAPVVRGLGTAALLGTVLAACRARARGRAELFGLLLAATACAPAASLLQLSTNLQESRHFHIPAAGLALALASLLVAPGASAWRTAMGAARGALLLAAMAGLHRLNNRPWNEVAAISQAIPDQFARYVPNLSRGANVVLYGLDVNHQGVIVGLAPTFKEAIRLRYSLFDFFQVHLLVDSRKDHFGQEKLDPRSLLWGERDYAFEWNPERRELVSRTFALRRILREREAGRFGGAARVWDFSRAEDREAAACAQTGAPLAEADGGLLLEPAKCSGVQVETGALPAPAAGEIAFAFSERGPARADGDARFELRWAAPGAEKWTRHLYTERLDAGGERRLVFAVGRRIPWLLAGDVGRIALWLHSPPGESWVLRRVEWRPYMPEATP